MAPALVFESLSWAGRAARSVDAHTSIDPNASSGNENTGTVNDIPSNTEYVAFVLVPVFFIMGLVGVLICHLLKKKGYRCTTEAEPPPVEEKIVGEKIEMHESNGDTNTDTVGHIVNFIMKNEANADVLKAMVADNSVVGDTSVFDPESPTTPNTPTSPLPPDTPISPTSPTETPSKHSCRGSHLHTVGGVAERNVCSRCTNKRWHLIKSPQKHKEPRRSHQGAVTVLSVGRFRVTKVEPKSKERKRLMADRTEATNGEIPVTPVRVDTRQRSGTDSEPQSPVDT
ncbi:RELT-like 1 L homeolog [Xenopus laevis]|uniref:RELT-like 1 L homeolog n=1 Tax=Xenopus laevis TaxID=8355 RepID=A0A8J0PUQ1_XENLA|nr:RELT-like 1 L homeolog [Xenopus laevis]